MIPEIQDEIAKLPKILAGEIPDRPPPSVPLGTPPLPEESPPGTSTGSEDEGDLIHYHHHESNRCKIKSTVAPDIKTLQLGLK